MGQQISYCKTGTDASIGSVEPHIGESRKRRLPGTATKSLLLWTTSNNTNVTNNDEATASTGLSSFKTSFSPPYPPSTSSRTTDKNSGSSSIPETSPNCCPITTENHIHNPLALRYTTSTRNLQNPTKEAATTTRATSIPSMPPYRSRFNSDPQKQRNRDKRGVQNHSRKVQPFLLRGPTAPIDKRSNPVKFPRKSQTYGCQRTSESHNATFTDPDASSHSHENLQDTSYLERMYDSRTWEMYRRITTHREKVDAFNAANASAKEQRENNDDDRNYSATQTYMSDPVQRVTNSSTMEGGVDYDNFYDPAMDDDNDSRGGAFILEDHSAPPYHHHRQCDNGQHHHHHGGACYHQYVGQCNKFSNNTETYSEWEHMYGDDVETEGNHSNDATNAHRGQHETIFLFDF